MWNVKSIGAINFLSHEKTIIEVKGNETTLIYGKNITDKGFNSNGSGKSGILEILYFCLTGNSLRKVKNKELIRNGQDEANTVLILENPVIPMTLKIMRDIHSKKATNVLLYENDVLREDLMDLKPSETDKVILEHLEISASDLANYYLISKEKYTSLLLSSDTQKKEVINRFSKANYIDVVFPQIDQDISSQEEKTLKFVKVKDSHSAKIELLTEQIEELKIKDIDVEKKERIDKINLIIEDKLNNVKQNIVEEQSCSRKVEEQEKKKIELEVKLKKLPNVEALYKEVDSIEQRVGEKEIFFKNNTEKEIKESVEEVVKLEREVTVEINELLTEEKKTNETLAMLNKIAMGEIECPKCKHTFLVGKSELTLEECKEQISVEKQILGILESDISEKRDIVSDSNDLRRELENDLRVKREEFKLSIQSLNDDITVIRAKISESGRQKNEIEKHILDAESSISIQQGNQDRANNKIKTLESEIEEHNNKITEIEKEPNPIKEQIKTLNSQIKEQEKAIVENEKLLEKEQIELDELIEWKVNFKRFKSFLANQSLALIEQQANHFLNKMRCDNRVYIDGFRELANGKMKEEISIEISRDNLETESFGKFSGGEKAKVDLSCILAMQTLINISCKNGGLDLLFCDEILESADDEAMDSIASSLSNVDKTVFMIAQSQPNVDCNMLEVVKENKISRILN